MSKENHNSAKQANDITKIIPPSPHFAAYHAAAQLFGEARMEQHKKKGKIEINITELEINLSIFSAYVRAISDALAATDFPMDEIYKNATARLTAGIEQIKKETPRIVLPNH